MPVEHPPDPADIAAALDALAQRLPDDDDRQTCHWARRYVLAGLDLAREVMARRLEEGDP